MLARRSRLRNVSDVIAAFTWNGGVRVGTERHERGIVKANDTNPYEAFVNAQDKDAVRIDVEDAVKITSLIERFRRRGHLCAKLDPLKRVRMGPWMSEAPNHQLRGYDRYLVELLDGYPRNASEETRSWYIADKLQLRTMTNPFTTYFVGSRPSDGVSQYWKLTDIVEQMEACYCDTLSIEAEHLTSQEQIDWISQRFENRQKPNPIIKRQLLHSLIEADQFERFLAQKFQATKRFGLEGCEALLPAMRNIIELSSRNGVEKVEIGIAHRGRLNVLCNLLGKPFGALCNELAGCQSELKVGDVLYHLGQSGQMTTTAEDGSPKSVRLFVAPNPSHLEFINPVVLGMVRAEQKLLNDVNREKVMGLLVHGDASFCGLGIVAETLQLSNVDGFQTGGVIHIVLNNQIGFTTTPASGRSGLHATDVVKMIGAPVLHANADDPEAVHEACMIATEWRRAFGKDIVIDIVGYRRHGHNERDDPDTFLPLTYERVKQHPRVEKLYTRKLINDGTVSVNEVSQWTRLKRIAYEKEWQLFEQGIYKESAGQFLSSNWQGEALKDLYSELNGQHEVFDQEPTGLPTETLQLVGRKICQIPNGFVVHKHYNELFAERSKMIADVSSRVNWGMAEALAFGTLVLHRGVGASKTSDNGPLEAALGLNKGHYHVRLSGQDVERGTFNHRHAVLYDQQTGARCVKLNEIVDKMQDSVEIWNSPLSEAAVVGFEYGYSLGFKDKGLVIWESQFGDFANNAQVYIDQFLASGQEKWGQQSGLVLLLPHGYDGEGPDHSSGRLERFLSLCNDDPDHLPGHSPAMKKQISQTFDVVTKQYGGKINRSQATELLTSIGVLASGHNGQHEMLDQLWQEMGVREDAPITQSEWQNFMVQHSRRHAERRANLFVVNATTPAQFFHALRRQCNLPYKKPLVIMSPKFLHHHHPCTSALSDFATGTFFNRVIDDGKISDNTRHRNIDTQTGTTFLYPHEKIRRVIICSGQIFYHLSSTRRAKGIRDAVLVRLEQISPFPHDLITRIVSQYSNAEIVWCQEEPKNMGAWSYVKPRMETAMRELCSQMNREPRSLHYIGRPVSATTATASFRIHRQESKEILEAALTL